MDQPTTRREKVSSTTAQYTQPSLVRCWVMSETHNASGRSATNWRLTRSGAESLAGSRQVQPRRSRRCTDTILCSRMSRSTRLRPTRISRPSRSSAWIRGEP